MDSSDSKGTGDATMVMGYDDYLGRFVDAVQHDTLELQHLLESWRSDCPDGWRERFETDTAEIAKLVEDGVFGRTAEDAA